jgi:prepilin-type N-terminal cleavage/methylation domain-containing protein
MRAYLQPTVLGTLRVRKEREAMKTGRSRGAFTLIEVLIVVVIMAVLAATIIPQFATSTKDAQNSTVTFNAHTMQSQIALYQQQHLGTYPAITNSSLPQLWMASDVNGTTQAVPDTNHPYGPYLSGGTLPSNPFNSLATVKAVAAAGTPPTTGDGTTGWQYDATTGGIWPNHSTWTPTSTRSGL